MSTHTHLSDQPTLFEMHPEGTEPPVSQRVITPGCLLPIAHNLVVDVSRATAILGVDKSLIVYMIKNGLLQGYQLRPSMRWMVTYDSIVHLCDKLRVQYHIRDRRPKLAAGRRWRDVDLLPFPISDTVTVKDVATGLDVPISLAYKLTEEGTFESYKLFGSSTWRISKTSLYRYRDHLRAKLQTPAAFAGRPPSRKPKR